MAPRSANQSDGLQADGCFGSADESAEDTDLVMLRGLEILREWLAEPEIAALLDEADDAKSADGARGQQA